MNFEPPPFTYSSRRSTSTDGGPKAVEQAKVASSTRPRGMKGPAMASAAADVAAMQ